MREMGQARTIPRIPMLRIRARQALGANLTKRSASGRHPRLISALLALAATRMGRARKVMGI
jgi:hypothetical protein